MLSLARSVALLALLAAPASVHAAEPPGEGIKAAPASATLSKLAEQHFRSGLDLYRTGELVGARVEFQAAYDLCKLPDLLHNLSHVAQLEGKYGEAIALEERYLAESKDLSEMEQDQARGRIARLREKLTADRGPTEGAPTTPTPPKEGERKPKLGVVLSSVGIGTGIALTLTGVGLLGAAGSLARSIEQEPRNSVDLMMALERRDRLEAGAIGLLVAGPLVTTGFTIWLVKTKKQP